MKKLPTRYKRFRRHTPADLPPMRLTGRDIHILSFLSSFGLLDTSQIVKLLSLHYPGEAEAKGNINRLRHRLNMLYQHRYIERPLRQYTYEKNRKDLIHMLGDRGIRELFPDTPARPGVFREKSQTYTTPHIKHTMETNDFRVALTLAAHRHPGATLKWWRQGSEIEDKVSFFDPNRELHLKRTIKPDGFFVLEDGQAHLPFMVEIDRSTMTLERIRQKIRLYRAWKESGGYEKKFKYKGFRVLFVATESVERKENLRAAAKEADPKGEKSRMFLFTHAGRYSLVDPGDIFKSIWQYSTDHDPAVSEKGSWHHLLE